MTSFMARTARQFVLIKAAREIRQEIERAGLDNLKILADAGKSIVGTYLNGCSSQEKTRHKQELITLLRLGVTPDMLLDEIAGQMPTLAPIIESKRDYKKAEVEALEKFLKEG